MPFAPTTGHGATLEFGTTATWVAEYISIGGTEQTRESLDIAHLGTTGYRKKIPTDIVDPGGFDCEFYYNPGLVEPNVAAPGNLPPITSDPEEITITFPLTGVGTSAGVIFGSGFVTSFSTPELTSDGVMTGSIHVEWATGPAFTEEVTPP